MLWRSIFLLIFRGFQGKVCTRQPTCQSCYVLPVNFGAVRTFRNVRKYLESEENMKQSLLACMIRRLNFVLNLFKIPKILFI